MALQEGMQPNLRPKQICLLIIDMINELKFDGAQDLLPCIRETARNIAKLKDRMKVEQLPIVYVNDNFGRWKSDFRTLVSRCLEEDENAKSVVQLLMPRQDDYFVLKPKHSGFYATPLDLLLEHLGVRRLILTGLLGNNCVLYTAADAYMRGYEIFLPSDCMLSFNQEANRVALEQMKGTLNAVISTSDKVLVDAARD
jgi:nicotinamidase-related amidase